VFIRSYNWVATGSMDQKLIIWDLSHQSSRCSCEHDVSCFLLFLVVHTIYFLGLFVMRCVVKSTS
jgi:angio-associated migratory cell protein